MYYLVHRLVGITLYCRLITAWLIQMTPWPWWHSAHPQCLKMPSCLSWNRGASRGFMTPSTSVWDIVCPLLSYRSVQCIFINMVLKLGKADKNVLLMKWWISNVCNSFCVVEGLFFFWIRWNEIQQNVIARVTYTKQWRHTEDRFLEWYGYDIFGSGGYCTVF